MNNFARTLDGKFAVARLEPLPWNFLGLFLCRRLAKVVDRALVNSAASPLILYRTDEAFSPGIDRLSPRRVPTPPCVAKRDTGIDPWLVMHSTVLG